MALSTTAAVVMMAAGSAISAIGAIQSGQATAASARFQAGIMRQQAERERLEAEGREDDFRRDASRLMARRRATLGATGVEPTEGSPLLVTEDMAGETELQALRIRSGGELNATRLEQQAMLEGFRGRVASREGFMRAGAALLSGAGQAAWMSSRETAVG